MEAKTVFYKNGEVKTYLRVKFDWKEAYNFPVLSTLLSEIQIEEGTTLGQFLGYFLRADEQSLKAINQLLVIDSATDDVLSKFKKVAEENPASSDTEILYTEVYLTGIQMGYAEQSQQNWLSYHGVDTEGGVAIEFSPISKFWNLPLKIKNSLPIYKGYEWDEEVYRTSLLLTVLDVLVAVSYEMTFFGVISSESHGKAKMEEILPDNS